MRPTLLEIEGFTCYREKQKIRFEDVDGPLAIAGPTGSGKSTVLDAMLFALYGRVPRVSNRVAKLVSQGMTRAAIRFEFDLGDARYRLVRTVYSNTNPSTAQLERVDTNQRIADGVRAVDDQVRLLLGLDLEAFVQSVVLPQGRFAEFLTSEPKKRRDLVMELLGLSVYGRMHGIANNEAKSASTAAIERQRSLDAEYRDATGEAVAALELQVSGLTERIAALDDEEKALRAALQRTQKQWEASQRLARARQDLGELDAARPQLDSERSRIDASRRARRAQPAWTAAREAEAQASSRASGLSAAEETAGRARKAEGRAREAQDEAESRAAQVSAWRAQLDDLHDREGRLIRLADLEKEVVEATQRLSKATDELAGLTAKKDEVLGRIQNLAVEQEEVGQQLRALSYDPAHHQRLAAQAQTAREALRLEGQLTEEGLAVHKAEATHHEAARLEAQARATLDEAIAAREAASQAAQTAADAQRAAERAHGAASLRAHLHDGDTCPVCLRPVDQVPEVEAPPEVAEADKAVASAKATARRAESALETARSGHRTADQALQRTTAQLAVALEAEARTRSSRDEALRVLEREVANLFPSEGSIPEHLLEALAASEQQRQHHDTLQAQASEARREHELAESRRIGLLEQIQTHESLLAELRSDLEVRSTQASSSRQGLEDWTLDRVHSERNQLEETIRQAEGAVAQTAAALANAREALASAEASWTAARTVAEEAARAADTARASAEEALAAAGFATSEEAERALVPEDEETSIDARHREHERKRAAAESVVAEVEPVVGQAPATEADVGAAEEAVATVAKEIGSSRQALGSATTQLDGLRDRLVRSLELRKELAAAQEKAAVYEALAAELRSDRFPEWVLETEFRELVRGASDRWFGFTDRYGLRYENNEFLVVDHDNAQETRTVDTLSGGETFLCSLALALELSEQIQRRAGALRFDCLFIDEGFGSLDPETLDTVAEAIETLGAGRRMVGLISHVAALTERMPSRLTVTKGAVGSTAVLSVAP